MTPHAYSFFNLMNYWNSFTAVMNANLFYGYDNTKVGYISTTKSRDSRTELKRGRINEEGTLQYKYNTSHLLISCFLVSVLEK